MKIDRRVCSRGNSVYIGLFWTDSNTMMDKVSIECISADHKHSKIKSKNIFRRNLLPK